MEKKTTNLRQHARANGGATMLCHPNYRWLWLREHEGQQAFTRSNYEPTKADGLVGQYKKFLKLKDIEMSRAKQLLGITFKLKRKPVERARVNVVTDDFWSTVETVKPKGRFDGVDLRDKNRKLVEEAQLLGVGDDDVEGFARLKRKGRKSVLDLFGGDDGGYHEAVWAKAKQGKAAVKRNGRIATSALFDVADDDRSLAGWADIILEGGRKRRAESKAAEEKVPFLVRLARANDAEGFADALHVLYYHRPKVVGFDIYALFCEAGWAEGFTYCSRREYVIGTAHDVLERSTTTREANARYWTQRKFDEAALDHNVKAAIAILKGLRGTSQKEYKKTINGVTRIAKTRQGHEEA